MAICHDGSEGDGLDRDGLETGDGSLSPLSPEAVSEPSPPVAGQVAALF